ncbi:hypothetical protein MMC20_006583 [Loxospora ochrophaea]|nr:hypothetical protein [Loxospora ochrophaea]
MLSAETLKTSRGCTETDPQLYDTTVMELGRLTEKQLLQLQTEVDNTGTLQERTRAIQPSRQSAENRVITLLDVARQSETLQAEQPEVSFMQRLNLGATPEPFTRSSLPQSPSHYKALKAAVLSEAGVVFTTCSNSANKELVVKYKPQIIIFDEAAFTKEMESILPMIRFGWRFDEWKQKSLATCCNMSNNRLQSSLSAAKFTNAQYSPSKNLLSGCKFNLPMPQLKEPLAAVDLWNFWKETWHEPGVYEERPDGPRVAESQKAESYLVENLVQYGVTPSHIGVVAFYTAQVGNLRWYQFNKNIPQAGYDEVEVCTTRTPPVPESVGESITSSGNRNPSRDAMEQRRQSRKAAREAQQKEVLNKPATLPQILNPSVKDNLEAEVIKAKADSEKDWLLHDHGYQ